MGGGGTAALANQLPKKSIRSLESHDDDGNKTPQICILDNENSIFARFARAFFIFWHFEDVLVLSTTWNDLFCSCVDDVSIWWQMFNFVFLCTKRLFQFNSRTVRTHFSSITTLNNLKIDCRNAKLHFQMTFSLPSPSYLLKLPSMDEVDFFLLVWCLRVHLWGMELNTRREIAYLRIPIYPRFIVNNHFGGERNEKK